MATRQAQNPQQRDQQGMLTLLQFALALLILSALLMVIALAWNHLNSYSYSPQISSSNPPSVMAMDGTDLLFENGQWWFSPNQSSVLSNVDVESEFTAWNCEGRIRAINLVGEQKELCLTMLSMPPVTELIFAEFRFASQDEVTRIARRPANVLFMESDFRSNVGTGAFFHDGREVFYALWLAGDCTPRIFNGEGGYWQMPHSPQLNETDPAWGSGFLVYLPDNWQSAWSRVPQAAAPWRSCGASQFIQPNS